MTYWRYTLSKSEFGVAVWNSSLSGDDVVALERVQKNVLHVVMGEEYDSNNSALKATGLKKLSERRKKISFNFAKKAQKNPNFTNWLKLNPKVGGRSYQPKYCPVVARTSRFQNSPISDLLNSQ